MLLSSELTYAALYVHLKSLRACSYLLKTREHSYQEYKIETIRIGAVHEYIASPNIATPLH